MFKKNKLKIYVDTGTGGMVEESVKDYREAKKVIKEITQGRDDATYEIHFSTIEYSSDNEKIATELHWALEMVNEKSKETN